MGRKLNAHEVFQLSLGASEADRQEGRAQLEQQYLKRIADSLGITTAQLGELPGPSNAGQPAIAPMRKGELILTQQCRDLIEAFIQIQDPQERLRCLQIVRKASLTK